MDLAMPTRCPRCGEAVVPGAKLKGIPQPPGHAAAWKLTHKREGGKGCAAVITEYVGHKEGEAAAASPDAPMSLGH
jgi:hypothetical protein